MTDQIDIGERRMRDRIAEWHSAQGYSFGKLMEALERDRAPAEQILRARWASSSHHAHAAHISRMKIGVDAPVGLKVEG